MTSSHTTGYLGHWFSILAQVLDPRVVGAGQQQVHHVGASVGSFHICLLTFTLTECWAWDRDEQGW